MDDDLNVDDDFFGFYEIDSIKSETVVKALKDFGEVFLKLRWL